MSGRSRLAKPSPLPGPLITGIDAGSPFSSGPGAVVRVFDRSPGDRETFGRRRGLKKTFGVEGNSGELVALGDKQRQTNDPACTSLISLTYGESEVNFHSFRDHVVQLFHRCKEFLGVRRCGSSDLDTLPIRGAAMNSQRGYECTRPLSARRILRARPRRDSSIKIKKEKRPIASRPEEVCTRKFD